MNESIAKISYAVPARNLINVYKNYYKLGVHQCLCANSHKLMTGLIYKFNEMRFPDDLKIANAELRYLSALKDNRTIQNARKELIVLCEDCHKLFHFGKDGVVCV